MTEPNPDLFFNRGTLFEYLERYNEATADFAMAHQIDPNLGADKKCDNIIGFVAHAYNVIKNKGKIKTNKLIDMVKSIPQSLPDLPMKVVDISQLQSGENPDVMVSMKIVNYLEKPTDVPMCFMAVDFKHNFCVTSIYHTNKNLQDRVRSGSHILIKNPHLVIVQLNFKGYQYTTSASRSLRSPASWSMDRCSVKMRPTVRSSPRHSHDVA
eukprot:CAMPEP_0170492700 /NCGR_PEP_ID=MMETSP0208-20121228/12670_1 /TAXON_ID=197538 /ORGANISM="Strombidium inclinatum, Strain S3" /LENGTH=210 /DNA_ID=CAMNT_0010768483 /DNA_START=696 /DNA_END=1325 /DNA_ORIENTATION=-